MVDFEYQGVDRSGKKVTGKVDAPNEGELRMILRGQGVRPIRIKKASILQQDLGTILRGGKLGPIPTRPLANFTRQLHVLVASGIPLVQALDVLGEQAPDPTLKKVVVSSKERVSQGSYFWEALSKYKQCFPRIYISLLRAGEASGAMDSVLDRLSIYLESTDRLARNVRSAMMYPGIVMLVGMGVVGALLVFVVPKIQELIEGSGKELPLPTQLVIAASDWLKTNIGIVLGGGFFGFIILRKYFRTDEGKGILDRIVILLPVFGELAQKAGIARFSRTLGTLLASGVTLVDAIDICRNTIDNAVIERAMIRLRKEVEEGKTLSAILGRIKVFPKMAVHMIGVGESTGNLEKMLDRTADIYESDVETLVEGLSKLIEPIMLVILGSIVAVILIAMYLPIFQAAGGAAGPGGF